MSIIDEIISNKNENKKTNDINSLISKSKFKNNFLDLENNYGNFKITVLGIGGAGCNVIAEMKSTHKWANNVQFYGMNTDVGSLKRIWNYTDVWLLGKERYRGGGSGGDPVVGETAANDDKESIKNILEGTDLLFLIAGLGKGTGSGAMPVIAKIAKEMNICTICLIHLPSVQAEGSKIYLNALDSLKKIVDICNSYCIISNDRIINNNNNEVVSLLSSYARSNEELSNIVKVVAEIINEPTNINIDFADVHNFFKNNHSFMVSTVTINNSEYTKNELYEKISNQIRNSYCNLSIDKTSNILANIDICEDTSSNIVSDIREVFVDLSKNKELWIVNGINYHKDDGKIILNFLISSSGKYNNDLNIKSQSDVVNRVGSRYIEVDDELINNEKLNKIQNEINNDELKNGLEFENFISDEDEEIANIHDTKRLDSNECNKILTEAFDIKDLNDRNNYSN